VSLKDIHELQAREGPRESSPLLRSSPPPPPRLLGRTAQGACDGKWNIRRVGGAARHHQNSTMDPFHTMVNKKTSVVVLAALLAYISATMLFALAFWAAQSVWDRSADAKCDMGIEDLTDAWYFSLEVITTLGFGVPKGEDIFFRGCHVPLALITAESLVSVLMDALCIGIVAARINRAQPRATSVIFSQTSVLRRIRGEWYLLFQVCEMRKHQLTEAHVRCFAAVQPSVDGADGADGAAADDLVEAAGEAEDLPWACQTHAMRLQRPDDDLGATLLMALPSTVVHRIDQWSPLWPRKRRRAPAAAATAAAAAAAGGENGAGGGGGSAIPGTAHPACQRYRFPEPAQRMVDAETGNREALVFGPGTTAETAAGRAQAGAAQSGAPPPPPPQPPLPPSRAELEEHLQDTQLEVIVLLEGIEPLTSGTLQARHSYSWAHGDMVFDSTFAKCVTRDAQTGTATVDFDRFHALVPCATDCDATEPQQSHA
jgi:potassium inwardly-rectifying channel subfamily J